MDLVLAKEMYKDEWARRDQLTGNVGTPIGVMTAVGGGIALMLKSVELDTTFGFAIFAGAATSGVVCLLVAAYCVARSYHGYLYKQLPSAVQLSKFYVELEQYHVASGGLAAQAKPEFENYLLSKYVEAAEKNSDNNVSKAAYLYRGAQALIVALICTAIAVVPWSLAELRKEPQVQRVVIDRPLAIRSQIFPVTHPTPPSPTPPPSSPTRPSGPPNRDIREGEQPKQRPVPAPEPRRGAEP